MSSNLIQDLVMNNQQLQLQLQAIREEHERQVKERQIESEKLKTVYRQKIAQFQLLVQQAYALINMENTKNHLKSLNEVMAHLETVADCLRHVHAYVQSRGKHRIHHIKFHLGEFKEEMRKLNFRENSFQTDLLNSKDHREAVHTVLLEFITDLNAIVDDLPSFLIYSRQKRIDPAVLTFHISVLNDLRRRGMDIWHQSLNFN